MAAEIRRVLLRAGCPLLLLALQIGAGPEVSCTFHGKKYKAGESWHPNLEPQGVMYCLKCTCLEDTRVNCHQIACPVLHCPDLINEPQQCCPTCLELHAPPEIQTPLGSACEYNGALYEDGSLFTTDEPFPSRQPDQCIQCSCWDGQIYCGLITCLELPCATPEMMPGSCCQVCRESPREKLTEVPPLMRGGHFHVMLKSGSCLGCFLVLQEHWLYQSTEASEGKGSLVMGEPPRSASLELIPKTIKPKGRYGTTVKIILKEKNRKACVYKGKTYSHGEVWHPHIHFALPCILCTCRDGVQDCQRVTCPKQYTCGEPEAVEGKCCKACPEDKVMPTRGLDTTQYRASVYVFAPLPTLSGFENAKENLRKMVIERGSLPDVEIYTWKFTGGVFQLIQIKKVKKQDLRQEVKNFWLVSRANEAYWNMLLLQGAEVKMTESPNKETKNL
ncbi:chordin-like protein 2 [Python bivittatus]|uniref:Chordin-like protein 2 n=1 Tax=Python bivittatus TaxID=176946 RepID=A0A9F5J175_PYTBI|nr:chordin-like protein 2 [Python bivittatus]